MAFSILIVFYLSQKDIWKYIVFVMCIQRDGSQKWKVAQPIKGSLSRGESWHPLNTGLLCVKYWPLCGAQEGGEGTHHTHTHTHTHTHSPPLEGHADKLFPSCSAVLVLLGSKHHSRSCAFQESRVNPSSVWAVCLHPSCPVLHYNDNILTATCG